MTDKEMECLVTSIKEVIDNAGKMSLQEVEDFFSREGTIINIRQALGYLQSDDLISINDTTIRTLKKNKV